MTITPQSYSQETKRFAEQRESARKAAFERAKNRSESISRRSGSYFLGRDEHGLVRETRGLERLGITSDKWCMMYSFRREDSARLKGRSWGEVEDALRKGQIPRKSVSITTHIIRAVRQFKHVRESYEDELERSKTLFVQLDELNISLAKMKGVISDTDVHMAVEWLKDFGKSKLARKHLAVKKIVAAARLSNTIEQLEQTLPLPPEKRVVQLSRACAVFTSLRNRLGTWRDKDIAGKKDYNQEKECAARVARDHWLLSQLFKFSQIPEKVYGYEAYDARKSEVVRTVKEMVKAEAPKDKILRFMWAKSSLFKVAGRERKNAEEKIAHMENGVKAPRNPKTDYLIGHYGWLYRYIKRGETAKALNKADYLLLFIDSNKPGFILEELGKDPDPYLKGVLFSLEKGYHSYKTRDFKDARSNFSESAQKLRDILHPRY